MNFFACQLGIQVRVSSKWPTHIHHTKLFWKFWMCIHIYFDNIQRVAVSKDRQAFLSFFLRNSITGVKRFPDVLCEDRRKEQKHIQQNKKNSLHNNSAVCCVKWVSMGSSKYGRYSFCVIWMNALLDAILQIGT